MTISLSVLALLVASGFCWSGLDLLRKLLVVEISPLSLLFWVTAGSAPLFALWVLWDGGFDFAPGYLGPALVTTALNVGANLAFFESVRVSPLSVTIPLLSLTPAFVALLAVPLLGELPTPVQAVGIGLVVAGALLLNFGSGGRGPLALLRAFARERGSLLMVVVAILWSASINFDKLAVERSSGPLHGLVLSLAIGAVALVLLAAGGRLREIGDARRMPGTVAATLVVGALALGLQLIALELAWVGLVETVKRGIGNTMAVVTGRLVFGEPVTPWKVAAVLLLAAGVGLVFG